NRGATRVETWRRSAADRLLLSDTDWIEGFSHEQAPGPAGVEQAFLRVGDNEPWRLAARVANDVAWCAGLIEHWFAARDIGVTALDARHASGYFSFAMMTLSRVPRCVFQFCFSTPSRWKPLRRKSVREAPLSGSISAISRCRPNSLKP